MAFASFRLGLVIEWNSGRCGGSYELLNPLGYGCDVIMKFLWEQETVKISEEFQDGCIPLHCGMQVVI